MADDLWDRLLTSLTPQLPAEVIDTWLRPARVVGYRENRLEVAVPN